jgi:hypothetical protein
MTEAPSEAFARREVVVLTGETATHGEQKLPPIIRTDAGPTLISLALAMLYP